MRGWKDNRWRLGVMAGGGLLLALGIWQAVQQSQGNQVEVLSEGTTTEQTEVSAGEVVVVDVAGAVKMPGLYRLDAGTRVGEALAMAGGLIAEADGEWVAKMMNQAAIVEDGQKIYIPLLSETNDGGLSGQTSNGTTNIVAGAGSININTATAEQLDSLWGIGEARAQQIIDNRPYSKVEELKSKAGIPENVYEANEGKWGVF